MTNNSQKSGFVRVLWGDTKEVSKSDFTNPSDRRKKVDQEIVHSMSAKDNPHFDIYILGKNNYRSIKSMNLSNCSLHLVHDDPWLYDPLAEFWRHKLYLLDYIMHEDNFDEIIYMDWDCIPVKPNGDNIWNILRRKESIQANLMFYRNEKCYWRDIDRRKVANGGFIYINNKNHTKALLDIWKDMPAKYRFWDEICISKLTDDLNGGWFGVEDYWLKFEPEVCNLKKKSASDDLAMQKDVFFMHYIQSRNNHERKSNYISNKT